MNATRPRAAGRSFGLPHGWVAWALVAVLTFFLAGMVALSANLLPSGSGPVESGAYALLAVALVSFGIASVGFVRQLSAANRVADASAEPRQPR